MSLLLGPLLRHVTGTSATVWVETAQPCRVRVCDAETRTFTVHGHHYALVIVDGLTPGSTIEYEVHLDDVRHWPPTDGHLPPSLIRTPFPDAEQRIVFGSCRAAAPHEEPYDLELDHDDRGRGVDALWALAGRVAQLPPDRWPTLLVMLGDQVYADDSSPRARERIEARRRTDLPPEIVADFEEYTWLYREAWAPSLERWLLSVVPSAMIFDDHDMIDDWNISASWVTDIRHEPWWHDHIVGGLCSYWIHQHLGNLSPAQIEQEGMLDEMVAMTDATEWLEQWALDSESSTPLPGGYEFSYVRELSDVRLVMIDCRNGRVLDRDQRRMVDSGEWAWIRESCLAPCRHLLIGSSLPAFVPGGLHGIQRWNAVHADGRPGRLGTRIGERLRRSLDLEDWPAFATSFDELVDLLAEVVVTSADRTPPDTVLILSGDIHFAYVADVHLTDTDGQEVGMVRQVVSSPIRNALSTRERRVIRFGVSRVGRWIGQRLVRRHPDGSTHHAVWDLCEGPFFTNNLAELVVSGRAASLTLWGAPDDEGVPRTLAGVELGPAEISSIT